MLPFSSVDENSTSLMDGASTHSCPATQSAPLAAASRQNEPLTSATSHHHHHRSNSIGAGHHNKDRGLARHRRNSWMRSSVVRRAATVVDEEVEALCEKSPFLSSVHHGGTVKAPAVAADIALFHRLEINLGERLGKGGFAEVYAVTSFDLHDDDDDDDDENSSSRRRCQAALQSATPPERPVFAVKILRKTLLKKTREFQHAAVDLAVEAQYLAALNHPNIIRIRGLTAGGTSAFRTGKHDDFFIMMDYLPETLDRRIYTWKKQQDDEQHQRILDGSSKLHIYEKSLNYAHQIADALAYLHDKSIVYRDLKPANIGFNALDVVKIIDFGLSRELPKRKGQSHRETDLEDEETFHMSGVGTPRYMAPEIITTRRYNLKADVYSWSMVVLEMMTFTKPFQSYTTEEHALNVAKLGERPRLVMHASDSMDPDSPDEETLDEPGFELAQEQAQDQPNSQEDVKVKDMTSAQKKKSNMVLTRDWPTGIAPLLEASWSQDVGDRLSIDAVLQRLDDINGKANNSNEQRVATEKDDSEHLQVYNSDVDLVSGGSREVVLEFPSHFSPRHQLSTREREQNQLEYSKQQESLRRSLQSISRQDSDCNCGDKQSETSAASYLELTTTSGSRTMHDSNSTS